MESAGEGGLERVMKIIGPRTAPTASRLIEPHEPRCGAAMGPPAMWARMAPAPARPRSIACRLYYQWAALASHAFLLGRLRLGAIAFGKSGLLFSCCYQGERA
jgi:hypothetical protein